MVKRLLKRILLISSGIFTLLVLVLVVHIYMVTRRIPPDKNTIAMARIDFRETLQKEDSEKITTWLYRQNGVDHVLCNPDGQLAVFTYRPLFTTPEEIVHKMQSELPYVSRQFIPDKKALADGCPVVKTSLVYKISSIFK